MLLFLIRVTELRMVASLSTLYFIWAHSSFLPTKALDATPIPNVPNRPGSPRQFESRVDARRAAAPLNVVDKSNFGYIWMSVPKNYRCVALRFRL